MYSLSYNFVPGEAGFKDCSFSALQSHSIVAFHRLGDLLRAPGEVFFYHFGMVLVIGENEKGAYTKTIF